jgi:peptidoglycan/LPS O-acetylase OafA/YrhL
MTVGSLLDWIGAWAFIACLAALFAWRMTPPSWFPWDALTCVVLLMVSVVCFALARRLKHTRRTSIQPMQLGDQDG